MSETYVFFPLHYEPERTTLPDGGKFHDQFKTICILRKLFPDNVKIVIKEHPSQFMSARFGYKGRSPIFYKLLKNINNLVIVNNDFSSQKLIKNAKYIATISGTVGFEAALLGKRVILFGETWFKNMPNVHNFEEIKSNVNKLSHKPSNLNDIKLYFKNEIKNYGLVGYQNLSTVMRYKNHFDKNFYMDQKEDLLCSVQNFITNYTK